MHLTDDFTTDEIRKIERIDAYYRPLLDASMLRLNIAIKEWTKSEKGRGYRCVLLVPCRNRKNKKSPCEMPWRTVRDGKRS